jgi:hypothetical protein
MEKQSWLIRLIDFLLSPFAPKEQEISVLEDGAWVKKKVSNPVCFSDLNEKYGSGNWSL